MYYGTEILKDAGFATQAAIIGNVANGVISVVAAQQACGFLVELIVVRCY